MAPGGHQTIQDILAAGGFFQPLAKLSATKPDSNGAIQYVFLPESPAGQLEAIAFDSVKNAWYQDKDKFVFLPKSADALIVDGYEYFLVEFKTKEIKRADILRKAYDSAMVLVEFGGLSWKTCKERLTFIVVGTEAETRLADLRKLSRADYMDPHYKNADADPRTVIEQIVKEFLLFTPEEFEAFAYRRHWMGPKESSREPEPSAPANQ